MQSRPKTFGSGSRARAASMDGKRDFAPTMQSVGRRCVIIFLFRGHQKQSTTRTAEEVSRWHQTLPACPEASSPKPGATKRVAVYSGVGDDYGIACLERAGRNGRFGSRCCHHRVRAGVRAFPRAAFSRLEPNSKEPTRRSIALCRLDRVSGCTPSCAESRCHECCAAIRSGHGWGCIHGSKNFSITATGVRTSSVRAVCGMEPIFQLQLKLASGLLTRPLALTTDW